MKNKTHFFIYIQRKSLNTSLKHVYIIKHSLKTLLLERSFSFCETQYHYNQPFLFFTPSYSWLKERKRRQRSASRRSAPLQRGRLRQRKSQSAKRGASLFVSKLKTPAWIKWVFFVCRYKKLRSWAVRFIRL